MTSKQILTYIGFKYAMFIVLFYFTLDMVGLNGWELVSLLFAFLATRDFVQGTRLAGVYIKVRKNNRK